MVCYKCGKNFSLPTNLEGNVNESHADFYKCAKCGKTFCPEHLKTKIQNISEVDLQNSGKKLEYNNFCEDCFSTLNT